MIIDYNSSPFEVILPENSYFMQSYKTQKDLPVTLHLRSFINPDERIVTKPIFKEGFSTAYVSIEKYQILMYLEPEQSLNLVWWDFKGGYSGTKIEYDHDTGKAQEKELNIKIEPAYIPFIDEFENLENDDIKDFAIKNNLNPERLRLYRDIFKIYDEGTHECVVWVQSVYNLGQGTKTYQKIVNVENGALI